MALSVTAMAAAGLSVTGLISANHAASSARQDSSRLSLQVTRQKAVLASESQKQNTSGRAYGKQITAIQSSLASLGHAATTARLGVCFNDNTQTSSDGSTTWVTAVEVTTPALTAGVTSCPSGSFMSVVPVAP